MWFLSTYCIVLLVQLGHSAFPDEQKFLEDMYKRHSELRKNHGNLPPLKVDKAAEAMARGWAKKLAAAGGNLIHNKQGIKGKFGENLAAYSAPSKTGSDVTHMWYNEILYYDFTKPEAKPSGKMIGHFTQLVWKGTTGIGCAREAAPGVKPGGSGMKVVVCNYSPPGNMIGSFGQNVIMPKYNTWPDGGDPPSPRWTPSGKGGGGKGGQSPNGPPVQGGKSGCPGHRAANKNRMKDIMNGGMGGIPGGLGGIGGKPGGSPKGPSLIPKIPGSKPNPGCPGHKG